MKKTLSVLLLVLLSLLSACTIRSDVMENPVPPQQNIEESKSPSPTPYTGTMEGYEYRYENDRDRKWEEDVLFLAEKFLTGHPLLADDNFYTLIRTIEGTAPIEDYRYDNSYYDAQLRREFIVQTNILLELVPCMSDTQIIFEMQKIVGMLHDAHSKIFLTDYWTKRLPIHLDYLANPDGYALYATVVPVEQEELLYAKLISVNGTPIEKIIEQLSQYIPAEVTGYLTSYISKYNFMLYLEWLQVIDTAEAYDTEAELVFEKDGQKIACTFPFVTYEEYLTVEQINVQLETRDIPRYRYDKNYWFEILEDHTLYIRFLSMMQEENYSPYDMSRDISVVLQHAEQPLKVVIDFRDNGGGGAWDLHNLVDAINRYDVDGVYILINEHSSSAAVIVPYILSQTIDQAVLIGTPAAQPLCFFSLSNPNNYRLPNSGMVFQVSDRYNDIEPRPERFDQPLTPDILVYQNFEDHKNGIDTVLEYVLSQ